MMGTAISKPLRRLVPTAFVLAALAMPAAAQQQFPGGAQRNPACIRLESQLATVDRGNFDPARAEQIRRLEDTANRQQVELDRLNAQARRNGCEGRGFFSLFSGQPQQCGPINNQIQQMRANLDRVISDLQRLQGNTGERENQKRAILASLAQYDCGPQYRAYANRGGGNFFENLFGPNTNTSVNPELPAGNTYRTLCVRTCDGFYFPVSYSTVPGKFGEDEKVCQAMCPAAEVVLFSHRNPGEDVTQSVSSSGHYYTELPNAFAYRKQFDSACSCKGASQTWADALKHLDDQTVERGDIVVDEERARVLSQPVDAQGRPIRTKGTPAQKGATTAPAATDTPPAETPPAETEPGKRTVRSVGPAFYPVR